MAYEFKKLSDVEVVETPADTVNVLIEEDGVIKKAPKTAVGGAGGGGSEELDLVIGVNDPAFYTYISIDKISILEGSMEAVRTAYAEGRIPKVKIIFDCGKSEDSYGMYGNVTEVDASIFFYGGYIRLGCMSVDGNSAGQIVSHVIEFDETGSIINHKSWYLGLNSST